MRYQPIGFELLPPKFTLSQLQRLYEAILERPLDKRNFRKKVLSLELLEELDEVEQDVAHRAARLYRFDERRYKKLVKQGFNFEILMNKKTLGTGRFLHLVEVDRWEYVDRVDRERRGRRGGGDRRRAPDPGRTISPARRASGHRAAGRALR